MEKTIFIPNINEIINKLKQLNFVMIEKINRQKEKPEYIIHLKNDEDISKLLDKDWLFQILYDKTDNKYYATKFIFFNKLNFKQNIQLLNIF